MAKRVELFAYPAGHSISPAMHGAAFAELGIDAQYLAREVPPGQLGQAVAQLRSEEVLGANVTIPHKEAILPLLDDLSAEVRAVGAVNTVVRQGERLVGHNTDVTGFLRALADLPFDPLGRVALVLGAGGAARAVAYALLAGGVGTLLLHNRSPERARRLADEFRRHGEVQVLGEEGLEAVAKEAELLVNTTSVGMYGGGASDASPLAARLLPRSGAVVDLVYRPERTPLLQAAQEAGLVTQNGLPMLVYQGAEAFSMWTGWPAPLERMRSAAQRALGG